MPSQKRAVTLKDIAVRARLSLATTSYALRNDPKISEGTRRHVQETARGLGYRPNPRIASLMAHIRRAGSRRAHLGESIAFVWVHTSRDEATNDPFHRRVFAGAQQRAEQLGFGLQEFSTNDPGMTDRRLQQILQARGIIGVVLSPVTTNESTLALDWDWSGFAAAAIGNVTWTPELHHAGHHHYLGMRLALLELAKLGCRRPAALIESESNERAKRAWEAAFLTHHPARRQAPALVRVQARAQSGEVAAWLRASRADALVVSAARLLSAPGLAALARKLAVAPVTLDWNDERPGVAGVDQCYDRVAAHAIDLVAAQLNSNETGVPDLPRMMLFPGRWVAPHAQIPRILRAEHRA